MVGGAIALSVRNDTGQQISRLWDQVAGFETSPSMRSLDYPPHLTFVIYDEIEMDILEQTVQSVFANEPELPIELEGIKYFDIDPLVLWASPRDSAKLVQLHNAIHEQIGPSKCHELYRPDRWIPHCTLGTNIEAARRDDAIAFASATRAPIEVVFDTVDWVSFPPVKVVGSHTLRDA